MDIHPEMRELREGLYANGIWYDTEDEETLVDVWSGFVMHTETTKFRTPDGRDFTVMYCWSVDEDDIKRFVSKYGECGYIEATVGDSKPYAAYAEEILEDALGRCQ